MGSKSPGPFSCPSPGMLRSILYVIIQSHFWVQLQGLFRFSFFYWIFVDIKHLKCLKRPKKITNIHTIKWDTIFGIIYKNLIANICAKIIKINIFSVLLHSKTLFFVICFFWYINKPVMAIFADHLDVPSSTLWFTTIICPACVLSWTPNTDLRLVSIFFIDIYTRIDLNAIKNNSNDIKEFYAVKVLNYYIINNLHTFFLLFILNDYWIYDIIEDI